MAKDIIHDQVRNALEKDGWLITDEQFEIVFEGMRVFVDIAAEQLIAAARGTDRIAVEIKSFVSRSAISELQKALGQYLLYRSYLSRIEPDREMYLAVSAAVYDSFFDQPAVLIPLQDSRVALIVVDVEKEEIVQWIS